MLTTRNFSVDDYSKPGHTKRSVSRDTKFQPVDYIINYRPLKREQMAKEVTLILHSNKVHAQVQIFQHPIYIFFNICGSEHHAS